MEGDEVGELKEQAEHGASEPSMRPVAFTMSVLAVLVAIVTVLGHRTHTEAVLNQAKASDAWNYYQAKNVRNTVSERASGLLSVMNVTDKEKAQTLAQQWSRDETKWPKDLKDLEEKARQLDEKVEQAEARANRFDLGEALLEIALVTTSITLLTHKRIYWLLGLAFGIAGIASSLTVLFLN